MPFGVMAKANCWTPWRCIKSPRTSWRALKGCRWLSRGQRPPEIAIRPRIATLKGSHTAVTFDCEARRGPWSKRFGASESDHHWFGACRASMYGLAQSASCSCIDLHQARCILSTSSAEFPFAAGYGFMVSFITATNATDIAQWHVRRRPNPSTLFFFTIVCRKAISCWWLIQS
jgi:hypothetical protein